jgi:16S rRNA (guanine966-N2)-methyltransferase
MTRIVGGRWGGRRLVTPAGEITRPTSEKVRAALASSLTAAGGLEGARVLDLYAGSGALGLELVSRGASSAVFVEQDRPALAALRANVATLGTASARDSSGDVPTLTVVPGDVGAFTVRAGATGPFDVVVADPPYDLSGDALLTFFLGLHVAGLLAPHADLVLERSRKSGDPVWPEPLEGVRVKKYGDTLLCYGRAP